MFRAEVSWVYDHRIGCGGIWERRYGFGVRFYEDEKVTRGKSRTAFLGSSTAFTV